MSKFSQLISTFLITGIIISIPLKGLEAKDWGQESLDSNCTNLEEASCLVASLLTSLHRQDACATGDELTGRKCISPDYLQPVAANLSKTPSPSKAKSWQELLHNLFNKKKEDNPPPGTPGTGGSRGDICIITPLSNTNTEIWSDRPLFVWRGKLGKIGVRLAGSKEILWSQTVTETDNRVAYTGEALAAGQTYEWLIFISQNGVNPAMKMPFKVMDERERDRIRVRLIILGVELREKGYTPEEIAWTRANYFANKELWSDVLQEVYSLDNPSDSLQAIIQEIPGEFCSR